ncbi:MAG TPA: accessory factor UbiK family protein [Gammaproteobacteria bacterium]|nr:accessory factor UbiK family protein [Gammaproteobacteria bacterium]HJP42699.1 accessory factor UbiK family protein [Gammaproteobacteria bacterium]|tara:strand:+ start:938 stop:1171 length:234 start_codon:yes stop_codon:yes gene_type:complete
MENNNFEDWTKKISALLPDSALQAKEDIEKNIRFLIKDAIKKMDLIERTELEEFCSIQEKAIQELQQRINELEVGIK